MSAISFTLVPDDGRQVTAWFNDNTNSPRVYDCAPQAGLRRCAARLGWQGELVAEAEALHVLVAGEQPIVLPGAGAGDGGSFSPDDGRTAEQSTQGSLSLTGLDLVLLVGSSILMILLGILTLGLGRGAACRVRRAP